jgi:hypothetical protein
MELQMTELVQIRTIEDLRAFMQVVSDSRGEGKAIVDKDLIWFVCMQEAEMLLDSYRTKDIASLFSSGVQAINTLEQVQDHLDSRFEDGEEYHAEQNRYLLAAIYRHFGLHDQSDELMDENTGDDEDC